MKTPFTFVVTCAALSLGCASTPEPNPSSNNIVKTAAEGPPDNQVGANPNKAECWKIRTQCCAECSKCLPTRNYGCDFQKCMRECMQCRGCDYAK